MVTNVKSEWVDGNLVFYDVAGNIVLKMDTANKTLQTEYKLLGSPLNPKIPFVAAADLAAGELVYISGWDATENLPVMAKADADASDPAKCAEFVCDATVAQDAVGFAVGEKLVSGIDTSSANAVGDPVYVGTTAGGWSLSAPSDAGSAIQKVGIVTVKDATTGAIMLYPFYSKVVTKVGQI
jgi:hypothetical protein